MRPNLPLPIEQWRNPRHLNGLLPVVTFLIGLLLGVAAVAGYLECAMPGGMPGVSP